MAADGTLVCNWEPDGWCCGLNEKRPQKPVDLNNGSPPGDDAWEDCRPFTRRGYMDEAFRSDSLVSYS